MRCIKSNVIQLRVSLVVKFLDNLPIYKYKCQIIYADNHKLHLANDAALEKSNLLIIFYTV